MSRVRIGFVAAVIGVIVGVIGTLVLRPAAPTDDVLLSGPAASDAAVTTELPPADALVPLPSDDGVGEGDAGSSDDVAGPEGGDGEPAEPAPVQVQPAPPESEPGSALPPARATWRADLEAEPGWAPTAAFSATVVLVEATDGTWHAEVVARGLQPSHRHGAGITWDAPFLSSFCTGMSGADGTWRCQAQIDMTHVPAGASPKSGDLGDGSGRIWAHGELRQS